MIGSMRIDSSRGGAVLAVLLALGSACGSPQTAASIDAAECPVCKHEGDLACVNVQIEPGTPRCECAGKIYYFCSDECRTHFQADPERYLPRP
jgi:Cu+-exporting ATPase